MIAELEDCVLDHIAVAVRDIEEILPFYETLGLKFQREREVVEEQGVVTAFAQVDAQSHLELLEPWGEKGPIHRYLERKGPGLHHLCFRVSDIEKKSQELRERGYILLNEEPVKGAHHCLVNFLHPKTTGGVLIEISQKII